MKFQNNRRIYFKRKKEIQKNRSQKSNTKELSENILSELSPLKTISYHSKVDHNPKSLHTLTITPISKPENPRKFGKNGFSPSSRKSMNSLLKYLNQVKSSAKKKPAFFQEKNNLETLSTRSHHSGQFCNNDTKGVDRKINFTEYALGSKEGINFENFEKMKKIKTFREENEKKSNSGEERKSRKEKKFKFTKKIKKIIGPKKMTPEEKKMMIKKERKLIPIMKKRKKKSEIENESLDNFSVFDFSFTEEKIKPKEEDSFKLQRKVSSGLILGRKNRLMSRAKKRRKKHVKMKLNNLMY